MPATAGRVRMPANNRVHSSAALQTHGIWQSAIGYDPYAPTNKDDNKKSSQSKAVSASEPEGENAYASFQGLLQLARITNSNSDEARGACKRCGRVGHLTFQCRNFLSVRDELNGDAKDDDVIREVVLEKLKGEKVKLNGKKKAAVESGDSSEDEEEENESSDSDYDSGIERIIAEKYGKKGNGKGRLPSRKKEEEDDEEEEGERRKKRGRSKKRRTRKRESSDSEDKDDGGRRRRKKRKEKRCRRDDDSSDDAEEQRRKRKSRREKRRRRSQRHSSEDSEDSSEDSADRRHKRRSGRASSPSDSGVSGSDDSRVGRDKKRAEKNSRKHHREREN